MRAVLTFIAMILSSASGIAATWRYDTGVDPINDIPWVLLQAYDTQSQYGRIYFIAKCFRSKTGSAMTLGVVTIQPFDQAAPAKIANLTMRVDSDTLVSFNARAFNYDRKLCYLSYRREDENISDTEKSLFKYLPNMERRLAISTTSSDGSAIHLISAEEVGDKVHDFVNICTLDLYSDNTQGSSSQSHNAEDSTVIDHAGLLDTATKDRVDDIIFRVLDRSHVDVIIWTTNSLKGLDIADLARNFISGWEAGYLGHLNKNEAVLLLVAPNERKVRIEISAGLAETPIDLQKRHILDDILLPEFGKGNFSGGIEKGVDEIARIITGVSP